MTGDSAASPKVASIRTHFVAIVLAGAIVPLALIGFWLTSSAVQSGEELLRSQLDTSLRNVERSVAQRWELCFGEVVYLASNESAVNTLSKKAASSADSQIFAASSRELWRSIQYFEYRDKSGLEIFSSRQRAPPGPRAGGAAAATQTSTRRTMLVTYPVVGSQDTLGWVDAHVYIDAIVPSDSARVLLPGSALAVRDTLGTVLMRINNFIGFPTADAITINGTEWMVRRQRMTEPPLEFAAAAQITPYVDPFRGAGRVSYAAIGIVAMFALILTTVLTTRLSTSLGRLVGDAEAVAGGELTRKAEPSGPAEVRHLATSFNTMTESLRLSIAELAERRSLAAVGEFATALSHEVRNALTSVQLDLERVDERSEDAKNRELVSRTLTHVRRLDAAVTGSLRIARSGMVAPQRVSIAQVLEQVVGAAEPIFARAGTVLAHQPFDKSIVISGDIDALHQLFLNLLLNALQALPAGGTVDVALAARDSRSIVSIADTGRGMTSEQAAQAFEPYYTTRPNGTGIGLTIAHQIAVAHGGELAIESTPGRGTTVTVSIPIVTI